MKCALTVILLFISASVLAQKADTLQKGPGNILEAKYNKWIQLGDDHFKNKRLEEAMQSYEQALKLKPEAKYPQDKLAQCKALLKHAKEYGQ